MIVKTFGFSLFTNRVRKSLELDGLSQTVGVDILHSTGPALMKPAISLLSTYVWHLLCHQTSLMPCILVNYTFNSTSERQRGKK